VHAIFRIIIPPYHLFYSHFQVWSFVILWNLAYVILGLLRAQITNVLCARYNIQILWGFNIILLSQFQCFLKWYEINHSIFFWHSYIICFICEINVLVFDNQIMKYKYGRYMTASTLMHFLESWWKMKEATVFFLSFDCYNPILFCIKVFLLRCLCTLYILVLTSEPSGMS